MADEVRDKQYWNRRALIAEANLAISKEKMAKLRGRASDTVNKATKVATAAKDMATEAIDRADDFELQNAEVNKRLERVMEAVERGSAVVSELEQFLITVSQSTEVYTYIKRTLVRACHPDKHQDVDEETTEALNNLFIVVSNMFGGKQ